MHGWVTDADYFSKQRFLSARLSCGRPFCRSCQAVGDKQRWSWEIMEAEREAGWTGVLLLKVLHTILSTITIRSTVLNESPLLCRYWCWLWRRQVPQLEWHTVTANLLVSSNCISPETWCLRVELRYPQYLLISLMGYWIRVGYLPYLALRSLPKGTAFICVDDRYQFWYSVRRLASSRVDTRRNRNRRIAVSATFLHANLFRGRCQCGNW